MTALYSNKTFKGNGWTGHFRADGKGAVIVQATGLRIPRTWQVKGNDQVCATLENGTTKCSRFQRHIKNRNEVIIINLEDGMTYNIIIEDGVPKF